MGVFTLSGVFNPFMVWTGSWSQGDTTDSRPAPFRYSRIFDDVNLHPGSWDNPPPPGEFDFSKYNPSAVENIFHVLMPETTRQDGTVVPSHLAIFPVFSEWKGSFTLLYAGTKSRTMNDRFLLNLSLDENNPNQLIALGHGSAQVGQYELEGTLNLTTSLLEMTKVYTGKAKLKSPLRPRMRLKERRSALGALLPSSEHGSADSSTSNISQGAITSANSSLEDDSADRRSSGRVRVRNKFLEYDEEGAGAAHDKSVTEGRSPQVAGTPGPRSETRSTSGRASVTPSTPGAPSPGSGVANASVLKKRKKNKGVLPEVSAHQGLAVSLDIALSELRSLYSPDPTHRYKYGEIPPVHVDFVQLSESNNNMKTEITDVPVNVSSSVTSSVAPSAAAPISAPGGALATAASITVGPASPAGTAASTGAGQTPLLLLPVSSLTPAELARKALTHALPPALAETRDSWTLAHRFSAPPWSHAACMALHGTIYEGELRAGVPTGFGTCIHGNGLMYEGCFVDGIECGTGILSDQDDRVLYDGSWSGGTFHGPGTYFHYPVRSNRPNYTSSGPHNDASCEKNMQSYSYFEGAPEFYLSAEWNAGVPHGQALLVLKDARRALSCAHSFSVEALLPFVEEHLGKLEGTSCSSSKDLRELPVEMHIVCTFDNGKISGPLVLSSQQRLQATVLYHGGRRIDSLNQAPLSGPPALSTPLVKVAAPGTTPIPAHVNYPDGSTYVGGFLGGRRSGSGVFTTADGKVVRGVWNNDELVN